MPQAFFLSGTERQPSSGVPFCLLGRSGWRRIESELLVSHEDPSLSSLFISLSGLYFKRRELRKIRVGGRAVFAEDVWNLTPSQKTKGKSV